MGPRLGNAYKSIVGVGKLSKCSLLLQWITKQNEELKKSQSIRVGQLAKPTAAMVWCS